ncbi:hypothetical protein O181_049955 [Austropuccinia psidii MF-1]|uniref:Uncharacterized protein n=1 Tax=Austropuccinia psidii MF-1 TaxID=1389203 RepID=A0A9Q3DUH6_9BASI|nr:hypothetical protein [Austropuccinia psidii MF-1]
MPCEQTLQQPTPGPSGIRWLEDLFCQPSQHDWPPITGPSPSSEPPEDVPTHEPEPEVAPTQSMEEPFCKSQLHFFNSSQLFLTPPSRYSLFIHNHRQYPHWIPPPQLRHLPLLLKISLPLPWRTQTPPPPSAKLLSFLR